MKGNQTSCPQEAVNRKTVLPQKCLPAENLSAELDGEYVFTPEEQAHLQNCPRCRSLYESYRVIDDAVTRSLMVNCPKSACVRIREGVERELDRVAPRHEPIRFAPLAAKIAAVIAIAALAGYLIFVDTPYPVEPAETPIRPVPAVSTEEVRPGPAAQAVSEIPAGVDIRNLQLTAAGDSLPVQFLEPSSAKVKAEDVALIPDRVKHVWLADPAWKTGQLEKLLRSGLSEAGIPLKNVQINLSDKDGLRAKMLLTRRQAAVLTSCLAAHKLKLVSPDQPQPEQKLFAGTGNETLEYEAVMIPRGK